MKKIGLALLGLLLFTYTSHSQNTVYTGTVRIVWPGSENTEVYTSANLISITITPENEAKFVLHFKGGTSPEREDYVDLTCTVSGTVENGELKAKGSLRTELKEGKELQQSTNFVSFKGTITKNQATGKVYIYEKGTGSETTPYFAFTANAATDLKPELTFPAGNSPKVFNKGWVFGASFSITDVNGNTIDLSDKVTWSGTASFNPSTGKLSHPSFNTIGSNKIILKASYEGKTYKGEYNVITVDVEKYAHVGSMAFCPADVHIGPYGPMQVIGPILQGSPNVFINGLPASRVGDIGMHTICIGPNSFTVSSGDNEVLIDGKPAAMFESSQTQHCGGTGHILGAHQNFFVNTNADVTLNSKQINGAINLSKDDEIKTGSKGLMSFSSGAQTGVTILPSTAVTIIDNNSEQMRLLIKYGSMLGNGNSSDGKKIAIELENLVVSQKVTKFSISTDSLESVIRVYDGSVTITDKTTGTASEVEAGSGYNYENNSGRILALDDNTGEQFLRSHMATVDNKSFKVVYQESDTAAKTGDTGSFSLKGFIKENYLYITGALLVIALVIIFLFRRRNKKPPPF